jgi:2-oxoglutarate ferredoxin oxidoreductase subunit delta
MVIKAVNKVEIYRGWCKKCGICIAFCPRQVLGQDESGYPVVQDADRCTLCQLCATRCPDFAITVSGDKESDEKTENGDKSDDETSSSSGK